MPRIMKLADGCTLIMGQSPFSDTYNSEGVGLPFFQGNADFGKTTPIASVWCTDPKKIAIAGDVLISVRAPIGAINVASEESCIGRGLAAIRPTPNLLRCDYVRHLLIARRPLLESLGTGSTFKAIGKKALGDFPIPVYSIQEQIEIEQRLELVLKQIENAKSQLSRFDELVKSRFVEMFGNPIEPHSDWSFDRIDSFCDVVTGNTPSRKKPEYYGSGIEWIKTDNITEEAYLTEASEHLSAEGEKVGRVAPAGSVLMACIAGNVKSIGRVAIADRPVAFNQQINALVPQEGAIETEYLLWMLRLSKDYLCSDINMQLKGILNKSNLSKKVFSVPPLDLQQEFAAFVQQVDKLRFDVQQSIDKLQMLYDSLAQEYFGIEEA